VDRINFPLRAVTPDYFGVMGMRLVEGRGFQISDDEKAPPVAIVNATLARRHFGTSAPIGQRLRFAGNQDRFVEIVGVVADTRTEALSAEAEPEVYLPFWQNGAFSKHLVVRALGEPDRLAPLVRRELRAIDPTAAVEHITTMAEIRRASLAPRTFALRLLAGFAVAATLLSLVGLYGVLSLSVGARTKEIAVRKAIGARGREIVALVLGEAGGLIAGGLIAGVVAAVLLGRLLETLLFGVRPADPLALGGAALVFGAVALMACAVPAYRAARVDLMESLRQE
jgi:putative ABC transport system permease protein